VAHVDDVTDGQDDRDSGDADGRHHAADGEPDHTVAHQEHGEQQILVPGARASRRAAGGDEAVREPLGFEAARAIET
jgi:hypothetical protein